MADMILRDVAKSYGEVKVLSDINLDIKRGELIVFVGPSGCGKSTLLRMIAGLERITAGDFSIDGVRMNDVPPAQRGIAMVFQSYALYPHMTVRDNMAFALKIAGKTRAEITAAVDRAAHILQLTPYLDRLPKALSGGQRQRVAIGRAIVAGRRSLLARIVKVATTRFLTMDKKEPPSTGVQGVLTAAAERPCRPLTGSVNAARYRLLARRSDKRGLSDAHRHAGSGPRSF